MCVNSQISQRKFWSLADMIEFGVVHIFSAVEQLTTMIHGLYQHPDMRIEMRADEKARIAQGHAWFALEASGLEITDVDLRSRIWGLRTSLAGNNPCCAEALVHQLEGIRSQLMVLIGSQKFVYIAASVQPYFEQDRLFGDSVYVRFPEARNDLKNAGNCLAAELYTAAIFHLMRVAEYGLRSLARKVRVSLIHNRKPQPLHTATWDKVINGIKSKLNAAHSMKYGNARSEKISFYSDLADRCSFVKDLWRNDVMHTRACYEIHDALAAFERVKGFMELLCRL
jgi:hypothetical protein